MRNNLKYYQGSITYDFELFIPKEFRQDTSEHKSLNKNKNSKKHKIKSNPKKASISKINRKTLAIFLIAIFIACIISVFLRAEVNNQYVIQDKLNSEIDAIKSSNTVLESKIRNDESYKKLEKKAEELGMCRTAKDKIVYIKPKYNQ